METETIDKLFLELSQFTTATTKKELELLVLIDRLGKAIRTVDELDHASSCGIEDLVLALVNEVKGAREDRDRWKVRYAKLVDSQAERLEALERKQPWWIDTSEEG